MGRLEAVKFATTRGVGLCLVHRGFTDTLTENARGAERADACRCDERFLIEGALYIFRLISLAKK